MRNYLKIIFTFFLLSYFVHGQIKRIYILDINKGDMPNDTSGAEIILSDENVLKEGDLSLKIKWISSGWVGEWQPKKANWSGMKKIKFNAYSVSEKEKIMSFVIKDDKSTSDRNTWAIIFFKLKPKMNKIELDLENLKTKGNSRVINLNQIRQWHFTYCFFPEDGREEKNFEEYTVYISNLRVESE